MADENRGRHLLFWSIAALGTVLDLVSKYAVFGILGYPSLPRKLLGDLVKLRTAHNTGTFFGLGSSGSGSNTALIVFTVVMMAVVAYMYLVPPPESSGKGRLYVGSLGMVFGGACGNLYDRAVFGHVRDFLDVGLGTTRWPTFNLADSWLTLGIAAYIFALLGASRVRKAVQEGDSGE